LTGPAFATSAKVSSPVNVTLMPVDVSRFVSEIDWLEPPELARATPGAGPAKPETIPVSNVRLPSATVLVGGPSEVIPASPLTSDGVENDGSLFTETARAFGIAAGILRSTFRLAVKIAVARAGKRSQLAEIATKATSRHLVIFISGFLPYFRPH
jgi:hypothetical protein